MENILKEFGKCIVSSNTLLFRGHTNQNISDNMFFATKFHLAKSFGKTVQVWKTKREFEVIFLVDFLRKDAKAISSIPMVYHSLFPNEKVPNLSDLSIKQDFRTRDLFCNKLYFEHNIIGWFSSIENKVDVEICLFNSDFNSEIIELIEIVEDSNEYKKDSLKDMSVLPSKRFFDNTIKSIEKSKFVFNDSEKDYSRYLKNVKSWILESERKGENREDAENFYYNLRLKLKI